jgi:hypothetical protein
LNIIYSTCICHLLGTERQTLVVYRHGMCFPMPLNYVVCLSDTGFSCHVTVTCKHKSWLKCACFLYKIPFSIQSCRSCYATQHLCQRSFYKIFVKFRNSKKNVLKIVLIIVNINKDENKSLVSNQFSLKNDSQGMYMSKIEICLFTARILQNQRMLCCGESFHD